MIDDFPEISRDVDDHIDEFEEKFGGLV